MLERAAGGDREQLRGPGAVLGAQHVAELRGGPGVGLALDAVGVGVERGGETALGGDQVAEQERGRLVGHAQGERRAADPVQVRVAAEQQRVVVEHLLEVRHHPARVDAVAGEPARELVVHPAAGHPLAGQLGHLQRGGRARALVVAQQELQRPSTAGTSARRRTRRAARRSLRAGLSRAASSPAASTAAGGRVAAAASASLPAICPAAPRTRSPSSRQAVVTASRSLPKPGGRVVRAAVERLARRGEEARHRPAALARHRLGGRHVDGVDVRPLLAVDLDRHEVRVELRGDGGVLERLVRHDVAPVAGRVAHREQHRHVAPGRLLERGVRPLPPVDRVVGVLEQVGRGGAGEPIGHAAVSTRPGLLRRPVHPLRG